MTLLNGLFMVSLFRLIALKRSKLTMKHLVVLLSPLNMNGGFPLSAPWAGLVMMLILCASWPAWLVVVLISSPCSAMVVWMDNWGWVAAAGVVLRGIVMPCSTVASIWGRMGSCSSKEWVPWRVAMWWIPPARISSCCCSIVVWRVGLKCSGLTWSGCCGSDSIYQPSVRGVLIIPHWFVYQPFSL